jgi:hypothetical protein
MRDTAQNALSGTLAAPVTVRSLVKVRGYGLNVYPKMWGRAWGGLCPPQNPTR